MNRKDAEIRQTRAEMEQARTKSQKDFGEQKLPRRYRLYDKIKENVSLRTVDMVIAITALLIYGIITGAPRQ